MKPGDKVYCVKNRINILGKSLSTKDNYYTILDIEHNLIKISSDIHDYCYYALSYELGCYTAQEFFISIPQLRKLKLDKLNDHK